MKQVQLRRFQWHREVVLGTLIVWDGGNIIFQCKTIERLSTLFTKGLYEMRYEYSPKFDTFLWELYGITGRSEIKTHVANYFWQLRGCLGVGDMHVHLNDDDQPDVRNSKKTLERFHLAMADVQHKSVWIHVTEAA